MFLFLNTGIHKKGSDVSHWKRTWKVTSSGTDFYCFLATFTFEACCTYMYCFQVLTRLDTIFKSL